jgi:hypothetical protein
MKGNSQCLSGPCHLPYPDPHKLGPYIPLFHYYSLIEDGTGTPQAPRVFNHTEMTVVQQGPVVLDFLNFYFKQRILLRNRSGLPMSNTIDEKPNPDTVCVWIQTSAITIAFA